MLVFCSILLAVGCLQEEEKKESLLKYEFKSEEGGFRIRFPYKPYDLSKIKIKGKEFQNVCTNPFRRGHQLYVYYSNYPKGFIAKTGHKILFDSLITEFSGKEVNSKSRKPFAKGEMVGEEIELGGDNGGRIRCFVVGDRFFLLISGSKEIASAFFDSFELTESSREYEESIRMDRIKSVERKLEQARVRLSELIRAAPKERIWKSKTGEFSVSASFVESEEYKTVTLKKNSGESIKVQRKNLCHDDLVYLAKTEKSETTRVRDFRQLETQARKDADTLKRLKEELKSLKEKK